MSSSSAETNSQPNLALAGLSIGVVDTEIRILTMAIIPSTLVRRRSRIDNAQGSQLATVPPEPVGRTDERSSLSVPCQPAVAAVPAVEASRPTRKPQQFAQTQLELWFRVSIDYAEKKTKTYMSAISQRHEESSSHPDQCWWVSGTWEF